MERDPKYEKEFKRYLKSRHWEKSKQEMREQGFPESILDGKAYEFFMEHKHPAKYLFSPLDGEED